MVFIRFLPFLLLLLHPLFIKGGENNCRDNKTEDVKSMVTDFFNSMQKTNDLMRDLSMDFNHLTEKVNTLTNCCSGKEKSSGITEIKSMVHNEIAGVKSMLANVLETVKTQGKRIEDQQENFRDLLMTLDKSLRENASKTTSSIMEKLNEALLLLKEVNKKVTLPATVISYTEASLSADDRPASCSEIDGGQATGVYQIFPDQINPVTAICDNSGGGGWTVIQKRFDGSVDFFRGWEEYSEGFGDPPGEYWLGLRQPMELYVGLTYFDGRFYYARYASFSVSSEEDKFQFNIGAYSGTAGDGLRLHNGGRFSTKDQDNDGSSVNYSAYAHGAWWYGYYLRSNLNGIFSKFKVDNGLPQHMYWYNHHHRMESLKASFMMIRPSIFQP